MKKIVFAHNASIIVTCDYFGRSFRGGLPSAGDTTSTHHRVLADLKNQASSLYLPDEVHTTRARYFEILPCVNNGMNKTDNTDPCSSIFVKCSLDNQSAIEGKEED